MKDVIFKPPAHQKPVLRGPNYNEAKSQTIWTVS